MHSTKSEVLVVASLLFLIAVLIYGPISLHPVIAAPPDRCFGSHCSGFSSCDNNPGTLTATCCWRDPGDVPQYTKCQTCHVNTDTGEYEDCTSVASKGKPDSTVIAPPPSGVAPPPSTTCPENTALDANGNCAPVTQGPTDQGTTQPPTGDNTNNPKHHKGQFGGSLLNGDNNPPPSRDNNNKPSKHHKGSDTLTLPPLTDQETP